MKRSLMFIAMAFVLFAGACKKDASTKKTTSGNNSWTLNGVSYSTAITNKVKTSGGDETTLVNFWAAPPNADLRVNGVSVSFKTAPTASGTYQLKGGVGGTLTTTQFELAASTLTKTYAYLGANIDIAVTVSGDKIKVVIPEISLKSTTGDPDVKLTATIQEL